MRNTIFVGCSRDWKGNLPVGIFQRGSNRLVGENVHARSVGLEPACMLLPKNQIATVHVRVQGKI